MDGGRGDAGTAGLGSIRICAALHSAGRGSGQLLSCWEDDVTSLIELYSSYLQVQHTEVHREGWNSDSFVSSAI